MALGRVLCVVCIGLITSPEESYECGVSEFDRETSIMCRP